LTPPNSPSDAAARLCFGAYEFDRRREELWKGKRCLALQPQPARVLKLLLSHPGETVLREDFQREIWGGNPSVDIDQSLNFCIRRLRATLNDRAESPRYIETVPRRGYRFIAPVTFAQQAREGGLSNTAETATPDAAPVTRIWNRIPQFGAAIAVSVLLGVAIAITLLPHNAPVEPAAFEVVRLTNDGNPKVAIGPCCTNVANDGQYIYFSEMVEGRWILARVPVQGGDVRAVATPLTNTAVLDVLPNAHRLLLRNWEPTSPLWTMPSNGETFNPIGDVQGNDASWSPNGKRLVYVRDYDLYVSDSDGANGKRIAHLEGPLFRPRWSPDGTRIRVTVYDFRTGLSSLWESGIDSGQAHPLFATSSGRDECCGVWTSSGKYFVYQSKQEQTINLRLIREGDLSGIRPPRTTRVTNGPLDFLGPSISPDGKRLFAIGQQKRGELMRYDHASGRFVSWLPTVSAEGLAFSKDGSRMVWCSYPEAELWLSRPDGTERVRLTPPGMFTALPRWSSDEGRILFTGSEANQPVKAYVVSAGGGKPETVVPGAGPEFDAGWSPDGRWMVYADSITAEHNSLHMVDLARKEVFSVPGSESLFSPRWSPDGRYIAALTEDSLSLRLLDRTTGQWRNLVQGRHVAYPSWSPDSRLLYFCSPEEEKTRFFTVRVSDSHLELVTDAPIPRGMAGGMSGWWSGVDRDGTPIVLRDASIQEVYAMKLNWH
jgi:Tol biopolymer transport system component/DNA-binding winged helix-turn-helix (wHTH) protein